MFTSTGVVTPVSELSKIPFAFESCHTISPIAPYGKNPPLWQLSVTPAFNEKQFDSFNAQFVTSLFVQLSDPWNEGEQL